MKSLLNKFSELDYSQLLKVNGGYSGSSSGSSGGRGYGSSSCGSSSSGGYGSTSGYVCNAAAYSVLSAATGSANYETTSCGGTGTSISSGSESASSGTNITGFGGNYFLKEIESGVTNGVYETGGASRSSEIDCIKLPEEVIASLITCKGSGGYILNNEAENVLIENISK